MLILASTYNGALFLPDMLASLADQTTADWHLLVRDDGSTDATLSILNNFSACFPDKVTVLNGDGPRLGPSASFSTLLERTQSPYIMLCDQDDVWFPDKIEKSMAAMLDAEQRYGSSTPLLVHTDLKVVDENLQPIADSFWSYQHLSPQLGSRLNRLLAQNVVTGCTVMINRALADLATPVPDKAIMHDWWLALVAAAFGNVIYLNEPTILYRQHGKNSVGAKQWGVRRIMGQAQDTVSARQSILRTVQQAQAFLDRFAGQMPPEQRDMVMLYSRLNEMSVPERLTAISRCRFLKHGFARNVGFLWHLIALKRASG